MAKETVLNSVEEVIEDFRIGKPVIVVDDEDRENEGAWLSFIRVVCLPKPG